MLGRVPGASCALGAVPLVLCCLVEPVWILASPRPSNASSPSWVWGALGQGRSAGVPVAAASLQCLLTAWHCPEATVAGRRLSVPSVGPALAGGSRGC